MLALQQLDGEFGISNYPSIISGNMEKLKIKFVVFALFMCVLMSCDSSKQTQTTKEDEETLRHLKEVDWPKAYAQQDTLLLDKILGEDFQMVDQSGNWFTKQDELNWIKEHATQHDSFYYEIKRLDILPNGTAIICGTGHITNDSTKAIYQSSNVLVKRENGWKAVLSHVSGYKELN